MEVNRGKFRIQLVFTLLSVSTVALFLAEIVIGSVHVPFTAFLDYITGNALPGKYNSIIASFRLPKAITGLLSGAALAVSGLQMQTVFRNPMAGPYVLGISSGASLGVAVFLMGFSNFAASAGLLGNLALSGAAWLGAFVTLLIILFVAFRLRNVVTILILGMMFGSGINAVVNILQYFSPEGQVKAYVV